MLVVRSKSEAAHASSLLPTGFEDNGFVVSMLLNILDALSSNTTTVTAVIVNNNSTNVSPLLTQLTNAGGSIDSIKQALSVVSAVLN